MIVFCDFCDTCRGLAMHPRRSSIAASRYRSLVSPLQEGATPLFVSSEYGHVETVRLLLEHSADVEAQTTVSGRETPSHVRALMHSQIESQSRKGAPAPPSVLSRKGATMLLDEGVSSFRGTAAKAREGPSVPRRD